MINSKETDAYVGRCNTKFSLKEYYGAISDCNKAIKLDKNNVYGYRNRGISKEQIGDLKGACSDWGKASKLGDKDARQWFNDQC